MKLALRPARPHRPSSSSIDTGAVRRSPLTLSHSRRPPPPPLPRSHARQDQDLDRQGNRARYRALRQDLSYQGASRGEGRYPSLAATARLRRQGNAR